MGLGMLQKWQGPLPCSPELSPTPYTLEFPGSGPTCSVVTDGSRQVAFLPRSQILCMAILILPPHFLHIDLIKRQRPHRRPVPSTLSVCCSLPPSWAPQHILTCHKQKKQSPLHLWQHFVFIFAGLILQNGNSSFYNLGFPVTIKAEDFYLYQLAICKCFCLLVCFINCRSISFTHFSIHLCFCPFFTNLTSFIFQVPASPTLDKDLLHICFSKFLKISYSMCLFPQKSEHREDTMGIHLRHYCHRSNEQKPATRFHTKIPVSYTSWVQPETHSRDTVEGSFIRDHL